MKKTAAELVPGPPPSQFSGGAEFDDAVARGTFSRAADEAQRSSEKRTWLPWLGAAVGGGSAAGHNAASQMEDLHLDRLIHSLSLDPKKPPPPRVSFGKALLWGAGGAALGGLAGYGMDRLVRGHDRDDAAEYRRMARLSPEEMAPHARAMASYFHPEDYLADYDRTPVKHAAEHLIGGKADGKPDTAFDPTALKKGKNVETEHTSSHDMAGEIAKDHLEEDPRYYDKLEKMEKQNMTYVKQAALRLKAASNDRGLMTRLVSSGMKNPKIPTADKGDFISKSWQRAMRGADYASGAEKLPKKPAGSRKSPAERHAFHAAQSNRAEGRFEDALRSLPPERVKKR